MLKKLIKAKLCIMFSLALVLLAAPLTSVKALDPLIGSSCDDISKPCAAITCSAEKPCVKHTGESLTSGTVPLKCVSTVCVLIPEWRAIGTWCNIDGDRQCASEATPFTFTCNTGEKQCVASVAGMACSNDLARGNKDADFGTLLTDIPGSDRCATGLICDPTEGECVPDFGQGKVPTDKLGETAEDIRDQIRNVINIALGFLGVAGVIVTIYGGALWMSAAGDDEKVGKAKKTIVSGLIGLVIIGIAWTIVSYVLTVTQDIA